VDTGVPLLFRSAYELGAKKERLVVKVAGGAYTSAVEDGDIFQIGKRNFLKLREVFWRNGVLIAAQDVGGSASRTILLSVGTGEVRVRTQGAERSL
jgi:chemotaxis protein CheD